jgi:trimethylamine--corrinoid protein Co-methyltransferase
LPALAGANLLYGSGMIESGVTFDFAQLVMDNELNRMVKFAVNGIPVNDDTLSVDVIADVGSSKDFLSHKDTYKYMRIQSQPRLIDRRVREDWEQGGSTDLYARALADARRILASHEVEPLPGDVAVEVREIVARADRELVPRR